jgi:hypothetical protein
MGCTPGTPGDLLNMALKALSQPPPPPGPAQPPPPASPAPPNMGGDPNTGAPQPSATPGPNLNTPDLSAGAFGPGVQPTAPPAPPTKAHKLLQILQGGLQGALAGRAASEQALIQSGGHRSGGAGMGFQAGYELPWQHAMQQQQLQQAQAQTALTQSQSQLIDTPMGKMPPGLAKVIFPSLIGAQSKQTVQGMKGDTAESLQGQKTQSAADVANIKAGTQRYKPIPGIGMFDTQTRQVIPGTSESVTITPEIAQDHNLPNEFVGKPIKLSDLAGMQRNEIAAAPTVKSSTDPLGMTTTTTTKKQLPATGGQPAAAPRSGAARPAGGSAPAGTAPTGGASSNLDQMAKNLVEGNIDPSQIPRRSAAYTIIANKADTYSRNTYGKPFDMASAASEYQYAKNPQTQNTFKMINAMTDKGGSIEIAQKAAEKLPQMDSQTLNNVFNVAATQFGSPEATNFHTAMLGLADEYSKVMGGGVSSDTGRQQGLDLLRAGYSKGQMSGAINTMQKDIAARKSAMIGDNRYLTKQYGYKPPSGSQSATGPNGHKIVVDGDKWVDAKTGAPI